MMYKRAALFLAPGILLAGILAGCSSPPPPQEPPQVVRQTLPGRDARPAPPPPSIIPARPVTWNVLELINKSAYELADLQFFISSGITLERGKGMQIDIELTDGEGLIQGINAHETIIIPKDTAGVLIPDAGPPGNPRALKICFDDEDTHTLTFRENPADNRFYLAFTEDRYAGEFTEYGTDSYKVNFGGEIPYLYVRLDEKTDDRPRVRELQGRYVMPRTPAPVSTVTPAPAPVPPPSAPAEAPSGDVDAALVSESPDR